MFDTFIWFAIGLSGILSLAACVLYPTKGEPSKIVYGFKIRDFSK